MPVAVETSKRKFHQILDRLTNGRQPTRASPSDSMSTSSSADISIPPAKRTRLDPKSRLASIAPRPRYSLNQAIADSSRRASLSSSEDERSKPPPKPLTPKEPPYFNPWSHPDFLERLKTFSDLRNWGSKPDAINEVAWAKRGWVCDGKDRVACLRGCGKKIVVDTNKPALKRTSEDDGTSEKTGKANDAEERTEAEEGDEDEEELEGRLVDKYRTLISEGHEEWCLWRTDGCKDDIYRLPIARRQIWQPQLRSHYTSLLSIADSLPPLDGISHPFHDDLSSLAGCLPSEWFSNLPPHLSALAFALTGWQGPDSSRPPGSGYATASCSACFRRLGLWLYSYSSSFESDAAGQEGDERLDVLAEHRNYCPWVNGETQQMPGTLAGMAAWQILERMVKGQASRDRGEGDVVKAVMKRKIDGLTGSDDGPERPTAVTGDAVSEKSREKIEEEDRERFRRLKEIGARLGLGKNQLKSKKQKPQRAPVSSL